MSPSDAIRHPARPYTRCMFALAVAWAVGLGVTSVGLPDGFGKLDGSVVLRIGIASGLIALVAAFPGWVGELRSAAKVSPTSIMIGFSAGVLIRLAGTVALVALCSYHLPAAKKQFAGMILAWYVYLTTVDVIVLAMLLPRQDGRAVTRS
ncbi:hypothetical protein NHH03_23910 [Stieleria sp. TO1_6]|uniref:hypothetical protein n=1 Tax=Stieleria tagensis TaxID=2956795 RepID=UPI00209B53DD|nr:hypothetical protein [Stieleria tagensis]MCO8124804.1 hypothetical protein [Stieleria tagensis]